MLSSLALWRDRRDRFSWPRVATLVVLFWPLALALFDGSRGALTGRPLNELIHRSGWWALVFLLVSLAITPLRAAGRYGKLVDLRRIIGVAAFVYALAHILLFVADQGYDLAKVFREIVSRLYLTIGFVAFLGLAVLAATSNDTMVKRLGGITWRRIHQATYVITVLVLVHFFQQTKADVTVPTLYAGLFVWLMGYRLLVQLRGGTTPTAPWLAGLAVAAGLLTLLGEAIGIGIAFRVSPLDVLATAFDLEIGLRPGWSVLLAGLAVAALDLIAGFLRDPRAPAAVVPGPLSEARNP